MRPAECDVMLQRVDVEMRKEISIGGRSCSGNLEGASSRDQQMMMMDAAAMQCPGFVVGFVYMATATRPSVNLKLPILKQLRPQTSFHPTFTSANVGIPRPLLCTTNRY